MLAGTALQWLLQGKVWCVCYGRFVARAGGESRRGEERRG